MKKLIINSFIAMLIALTASLIFTLFNPEHWAINLLVISTFPILVLFDFLIYIIHKLFDNKRDI